MPSSRGSSQPRIKAASPAWQADSWPLSHQGSPRIPLRIFKERGMEKEVVELDLRSRHFTRQRIKVIFSWTGCAKFYILGKKKKKTSHHTAYWHLALPSMPGPFPSSQKSHAWGLRLGIPEGMASDPTSSPMSPSRQRQLHGRHTKGPSLSASLSLPWPVNLRRRSDLPASAPFSFSWGRTPSRSRYSL